MSKAKRKAQVRLITAGRSPLQVLMVRLALLVFLVAMALGILWSEREGLKDQLDGEISFNDIAYFTAITITTVGYGDIVPVSDSARIKDALLITPLRLIIWLIFLGTAYELVLQRWIETLKMKHLQNKLKQHLIICGFGHTGKSAAQEAVARGMAAEQVVVLDLLADNLHLAAEQGFIGVAGDATHELALSSAGVTTARALLVSLGRDDAAVLAVLTARHLNPGLRIICAVNEEENIKLITQAGADAIIAPSVVGGHLMANSVQSSHLADYVNDLMCNEGRVRLTERQAYPDEVGKTMRELGPGMVVRIHRGNTRVGFWEGQRARVQPGDILLVIEPNAEESPLN